MEEKRLYVTKASAGTGKTFTLAAHYVALLMHDESYRSILAVTFTNKATAEMKERILFQLYALSHDPEAGATKGFLEVVHKEERLLGYEVLPQECYAEKAGQLLAEILSDFDNMRVMTIDAFLQMLLSGVAIALGHTAGYSVELDSDYVIEKAVDDLLSKNMSDEAVKELFSSYLNRRMQDEAHWDMRPSLINMARELLSEFAQAHEHEMQFDEALLEDFRRRMDWHSDPCFDLLQPLATALASHTYGDKLTNGSYLENYVKKVADFFASRGRWDASAFEASASVVKLLTDRDYFADCCMKKDKSMAALADYDDLVRLYDLADTCRKTYLHATYCTKHLDDMLLMGHLKKIIETNVRESGSVLLAQTANTLAIAMGKYDAEFILEKVGIRYRHIILDEFQDTSGLQWTNFERLVQEILAQRGSTLIVGDIKQSIYRWRNGDYTIMQSLTETHPALGDYLNRKNKPLVKNFRSHAQVVGFNLKTFLRLTQVLGTESGEARAIYDEAFCEGDDEHVLPTYCNPKTADMAEDGMVQLTFYPCAPKEEKQQVEDFILESMFSQMEELFEHGYSGKDMLILLRNNKEAKRVLNAFSALQRQGRFSGMRIISGDSYLLENSRSVMTVVAALKYLFLEDDGVSKRYLTNNCPSLQWEALQGLNKNTSLLDLTEQIISLCFIKEGVLQVEDSAFLTCFHDKMQAYVAKYGTDAKDFLTHWDEKMHEETIPAADSDDIRMMTIHKSKGLEGSNVFIPFCRWKMEEDKRGARMWCQTDELLTADGQPSYILVPKTGKTPDAGFEDAYCEEHRKERIDNLNLLYVALTRAKTHLFVYSNIDSPDKKEKDPAGYTVGELLAVCWHMMPELAKKAKGALSKDRCAVLRLGKILKKETHDEKPNPFAFNNLPADAQQPLHYVPSNSSIMFLQSEQAAQYATQLEDHTLLMADRRAFGNICHHVMEQIRRREDVDNVIEDCYLQGLIPDKETREEVRKLVNQAWKEPLMCDWFSGEWQLHLEQSYLFRGMDGTVEMRRSDRVMTKGEQAVVLDYKFGHYHASYANQVREYMQIQRDLGYKDVKGYIWVAAEAKLIEVK